MKQTRGSITAAFLLASLVSVYTWAEKEGPTAQIGELLIIPVGVQITKINRPSHIEKQSRARTGFHYVRFSLRFKNVGDYAICAYLSATLENTLNVGGG